jgi:signal transduction histidine kinase/DNA-binding NarL/FixJ family response regulator/HPt (histidine-containing phosphotransfer) domain-containing protein
MRVKLLVAFSLSAGLTGISLVLGWASFRHAQMLLGSAGAVLEASHTTLMVSRIVIMGVAVAMGVAFGRMIGVPYMIVVERMEALAQGDLDSPIPLTHHRDCVGRIAKAIVSFRDNAIAKRAAAEVNERQSAELREANAKLEVSARDLTQALESAEHASRAKSRFLAGMSHELRTPLNGLLGYARLLRLDGKLNDVQESRVEAMLAAGAHLLDMIHRVLDLSEIESDRFEVKSTRVDVRATAMACLDIVRPTAVIKGLALTVQVAPGTPAEIITDATRLRQVLLNLLGNAVKFTVSGSVEMRLSPATGDGGLLRVEVVDTGPGIKPAERNFLFEEFERLQAAVSGAVEGSGLGLALSMRLTKILGGTIGYEDNAPGGSIFWLELPGMAVESLTRQPVAPSPFVQAGPVAPHAHRRLQVLVVDDIKMNLEIAGAFLSAAGHHVSFADGGAEAVAAASINDYDVIVMDVRMPEMDGLEATRHIRALPAPRGQVPIVAMTAQAFAEQVVECHLAGMNGHVTKPFAPEVLCAAVRDAALADPAAEAGPLIADADAGVATMAEQSLALTPPPDTISASPGSDSSVFARMAGLLAPDILVSSLTTINSRGKAFLQLARSGGKFDSHVLELAEMAHTLGGCAGMFGFARLANASKRFEYAVQSNAPETGLRASDLIATVEEALTEIDTHLATLLPATGDIEPQGSSADTMRERAAREQHGKAVSGALMRAR